MSTQLTIKTQVLSQIQDPAAAVNITQVKDFTDNALTQTLNFVIQSYELPAAGTDWVLLKKGDIGVIREVFIILISTPETAGVDVLITAVADPNLPTPAAKTFTMRECFTATTLFTAAQAIWVRNTGAADAELLAILGGVNV